MNLRRILIHTPDFPLWDGGIATEAYEYADKLTKKGYEVLVITYRLTENDGEWDSKQKFKVLRVPDIKSSLIRYYATWWKTYLAVKQWKPDVMISLSWKYSGIICSDMKLKFGIPVVQLFQGNEIFDKKRKQAFWERKFVKSLKNTDLVLTISTFVGDALKNSIDFTIDSKVLLLGVDTEKFHPAEDVNALKKHLDIQEKKTIFTLARLVKRKGHETVLRALKLLKEDIPNVEYLIAGRGSYLSKIESMIEDLNLQNNVRLLGFLSEEEKLSFLQATDVFVMPSKTDISQGDLEGFGLVYLEANACKKPAIGSNEGGCVDAVKDDVNGYLVGADDYQELYNKLKLLFENEQKYSQLSKSSLEHVRSNCTWNKVVDNLLTYVESTIGLKK